MPTLAWFTIATADDETRVTVMASSFRLRRLRDVPRFLFDSLRIHRQVRRSDGALGVSLVAHPLRREFLTLSAWRDRDSVNALVRAEPHVGAMRRHRAGTAEALFTFWDVPAGELPVRWDQAQHRLERERLRRAHVRATA